MEKQKETSFIAFLKEMPSTLFFPDAAGVIILPFIKNGSIYEEGFKQYNRYKACIEKEECADRSEKEAFVQLIDGGLRPAL